MVISKTTGVALSPFSKFWVLSPMCLPPSICPLSALTSAPTVHLSSPCWPRGCQMLGEGRGVLNYNVFLGRRTCKLASLYQLGRTSLLISPLGFYVKTTLDPGKQGRRSKVPSDGINIQFTAASRREDLKQLGGREAASEVFENELWKGSLQNSVIRVRLANQFRTFHHQPHTKLLKSLHPLGQ